MFRKGALSIGDKLRDKLKIKLVSALKKQLVTNLLLCFGKLSTFSVFSHEFKINIKAALKIKVYFMY